MWMITGCTSGFGRDFVLALLDRKIPVLATCRGDAEKRLADLAKLGAKVATWDVSAPYDVLKKQQEEIESKFGTVEVLVNNAGFLQPVGCLEETGPEDDLQQFATNNFGLHNTCRLFLPGMRRLRKGAIINISSIAGYQGFPGSGLYIASKHAVEGISECLAGEVEHLGIKVVCVGPGFFRSNFLTNHNTSVANGSVRKGIEDYEPIMGPLKTSWASYDNKQPGDIRKGVEVMIDVVLGEGFAKGKKIPVRLPLGPDAVASLRARAEKDLAICKEWEEFVGSTNHTD
ncbi:NAD(P)-binding protein [Violaceomyces palustris]|uniref:NAD(P)-binding protein n=1 Tax=Violaceomyces palustris TaxID=1673888 RepID=A0ACD0NNQ6_9BASI|nr:NAD(P)-binding protein [Violaceomyces palustris]